MHKREISGYTTTVTKRLKTKSTRGEVDELDFINITFFFSLWKTMLRSWKEIIYRAEIFVNHVFDKELTPRIYKQLPKSNRKKKKKKKY